MRINPLIYIDFYKADHRRQYPAGTELVYSNFTPRKSRVDGVNKMVFFGLQYAIKEYLIDRMNYHFFMADRDSVVKFYKRRMDNALGPGAITVEHIAALHDLGYMPLHIKAVPEGTAVPMGVPAMTLWNTKKEFFWLTNYVESLLSNIIWKPCTSATTARSFRYSFDHFAKISSDIPEFVDWQGHDFSFRGMSGLEDACMSGAAHLLYFTGTDTVPAIDFLEQYYGANSDKELIGGSVPATEHSVMSAGGQGNELGTIKRLITELYPSGIVSIVSDTWDLFKLVTEYLPALKTEIMARNGKVVIRPDTGIPHKILNGDPDANSWEEKSGVIRLLDKTFGSRFNHKGYKQLDDHIGTIYGDGIDSGEQNRILSGLIKNGYASTNTVLGLGSYTYQYVTRDTYGTVCKATYCEIDSKPTPIFKSPKTGAWKKSHKGLLRVNSDLSLEEEVDWNREGGILEDVFHNGELIREQTLSDIRKITKNEQL